MKYLSVDTEAYVAIQMTLYASVPMHMKIVSDFLNGINKNYKFV